MSTGDRLETLTKNIYFIGLPWRIFINIPYIGGPFVHHEMTRLKPAARAGDLDVWAEGQHTHQACTKPWILSLSLHTWGRGAGEV